MPAHRTDESAQEYDHDATVGEALKQVRELIKHVGPGHHWSVFQQQTLSRLKDLEAAIKRIE